MSAPKVLFVVDAGPRIGGGHVMRSLTLARTLEAQGAGFAFLGPPAAGEVLDAFAPGIARLTAPSGLAADLASAAAGEAFDAIAFDHYGLTAPDHVAMARGKPVLVIDDLADRPLGANLVLDSGPARKAADYEGLIGETTRLLLGPAYAPVRPEFATLREPALAWRGQPVHRVLVAMGLTDVGGVTGRVIERLRPRVGEVGIDVVIGAAAPSVSGLAKVARRDPRLMLHIDTPHMARLSAEADIAVGAPGSSVWERCVVGLPSVVLILAENQRPAALALAEREAVLVVDPAEPTFEEDLDRALFRLIHDDGLRRRLAARSAEVCDGLGAGRTAEAFLSLIAASRG